MAVARLAPKTHACLGGLRYMSMGKGLGSCWGQFGDIVREMFNRRPIKHVNLTLHSANQKPPTQTPERIWKVQPAVLHLKDPLGLYDPSPQVFWILSIGAGLR